MAAEKQVNNTITIKVKLMNNKWTDITIDDLEINGAKFMKCIDPDIDITKYTLLNHANFKKLDMQKSIEIQVKDQGRWEIIPAPKSS